jgi:hypothetical protein
VTTSVTLWGRGKKHRRPEVWGAMGKDYIVRCWGIGRTRNQGRNDIRSKEDIWRLMVWTRGKKGPAADADARIGTCVELNSIGNYPTILVTNERCGTVPPSKLQSRTREIG